MYHLMDVEELAGYLQIKNQTIYNWFRDSKVRGIKVGGVWRFDKKEIDKWLDSCCKPVKEDRRSG